jgi:hypothetical protein
MNQSNGKKHLILGSFALATILFLGGVFLISAKAKESSSRAIPESFLEQIVKGEVTRIEVYYLGWHILTRAAITESALRDNQWDYKVIIKKPPLDDVEKLLRKLKLQHAEKMSLDFRLGYVFYSEEKELLSLFFANNMPVVTINGTSFKGSEELLSSLLPLLPHKAYKEEYETLIQWK